MFKVVLQTVLFTFTLYDEYIPFSRKWDEMLRNPDLRREKVRLLLELRIDPEAATSTSSEEATASPPGDRQQLY